MTRFGVLQCPVCDNLRLCPEYRYDSPEELKTVASDHLKSHRLIESKHGIFRVMMVRQLDRVTVDSPVDVPTEQWVDEAESITT